MKTVLNKNWSFFDSWKKYQTVSREYYEDIMNRDLKWPFIVYAVMALFIYSAMLISADRKNAHYPRTGFSLSLTSVPRWIFPIWTVFLYFSNISQLDNHIRAGKEVPTCLVTVPPPSPSLEACSVLFWLDHGVTIFHTIFRMPTEGTLITTRLVSHLPLYT